MLSDKMGIASVRTIFPEIKPNRLLPTPFHRDSFGKDLLIVKSHYQFSVLVLLDLTVALDTAEHFPSPGASLLAWQM